MHCTLLLKHIMDVTKIELLNGGIFDPCLQCICSSRHIVNYSNSYRLVAMCTNVPEFIHTHNNPTALQEELHERVRWLITSSDGVFDTTACHIPVHLAISNETLLLIIMIFSGFPQLVLLLSVTYRQLKGKQIAKYISGKVHNVIKQICT